MYYSGQLAVYNFCVHIGDSDLRIMCVWDESISGRGADEIGSCLLRVLLSKLSYKKHVLLWCDNCAGQNKNRMIVLVMLYLIVTKKFESIEIRFLVSGHSFLACDQDFAIIEKRKRKVPAMVPADIKTMIQKARPSHPFKIVDMGNGDFFDITALANKLLQANKLKISKVSAIKVTHESLLKNSVLTKMTYGELEQWKRVPIAKKRMNLNADIPTNLPKLVTGQPLNKNKIEDLSKMIEFLPAEHRDFYRKICNIDTSDD